MRYRGFEMPMRGRLTRRRSSDTDRLYYAGVEVNLAGCEALDHKLADSDRPVDYAGTNPDFNAYDAERRFELVPFGPVLDDFGVQDDVQSDAIRQRSPLLQRHYDRNGLSYECHLLRGVYGNCQIQDTGLFSYGFHKDRCAHGLRFFGIQHIQFVVNDRGRFLDHHVGGDEDGQLPEAGALEGLVGRRGLHA